MSDSGRKGTDRPHGDAIEDLLPKIGNPARNTLAVAGITRLDQLTGRREAEILALHGMGPKALGILRDALAERDLAFAEETPPS